MINAVRRLGARRGRYLAVLVSVLAVVVASAVSFAAGSSRRPEHGTPHPTGLPPARTDTPAPPPTAPRLRPGGDPDLARTRPAGGTTTSSTRAPTTPSTGAKKPEGLFDRQDPLPDGVPDQVEFFLGGGPPCPGEETPGSPHITGAADVVEIPTILTLCFYGFEDSEPLTVALTAPSRPDTTVVLRSWGGYFWTDFHGLPTDPLGVYLVRAEQGTLAASLEFTLRHANAPRLWLDRPSPDPAEAGVDVDIYLGGFPYLSPTLLHLYDAGTGRYRTSFRVDIDEHGEAHVVLDTKPDDRPGCYGIISALAHNPGDPELSAFCITNTATQRP